MQRALVVVGDRVVNELAHLAQITGGVQAGPPDQLSYFTLDRANGVHGSTPPRGHPRLRQPRNLHGHVTTNRKIPPRE